MFRSINLKFIFCFFLNLIIKSSNDFPSFSNPQFNCFEEDKLCEISDLLSDNQTDFNSSNHSSNYSASNEQINSSTRSSNFIKNTNDNVKNQQLTSKMYLETAYSNQINNETDSVGQTNLHSLNGLNNCSNSKNLINNHHSHHLHHQFNTQDSSLTNLSCESSIVQQQRNSPNCQSSLTSNHNFNCETDCLLTINQQSNNYPPNSFITNYSTDKMKNHHLSTSSSIDLNVNIEKSNPSISNNNNLLNYDYVDNKFDNLFYSNWTDSSESINNLTYNEQIENGNEMDYFILNSTNRTNLFKIDENNQTIESNLNLNSSASDDHQHDNLDRNKNSIKDHHHLNDAKKTNLLTASESQQLAELLTLNDDLNATNSLENCIQLKPTNRQIDQQHQQFDQQRSNWQTKSIFDWTNQELTEFLYMIAIQNSYPIDDLRAYFICYSPAVLANMNKDQMCCINNKYGSTVYQAISQFKIDFNNSFCKLFILFKKIRTFYKYQKQNNYLLKN